MVLSEKDETEKGLGKRNFRGKVAVSQAEPHVLRNKRACGQVFGPKGPFKRRKYRNKSYLQAQVVAKSCQFGGTEWLALSQIHVIN